MEFSRQEYWSGLPFPFPGDLPNPGIEPLSLTLQADTLPSEPHGKHSKVQRRQGIEWNQSNQSLWFFNREVSFEEKCNFVHYYHPSPPKWNWWNKFSLISLFLILFVYTISEDSKIFLSFYQVTYKLYWARNTCVKQHRYSPSFIILFLEFFISSFKDLYFWRGLCLKFANVKTFSVGLYLEECIEIISSKKAFAYIVYPFFNCQESNVTYLLNLKGCVVRRTTSSYRLCFPYSLPHPFGSLYTVTSSLPASEPMSVPFTRWLKISTCLAVLVTN